VLRQALAMYDDIARHLTECDAKLQALLRALGQRQVDLGRPLARAASCASNSTPARYSPTGLASISRASTGWG
jgi:hypothetical protein